MHENSPTQVAAAGTLADPTVVQVLDRLHSAAQGDWKHALGPLPRFLFSKVTGRSFMQLAPPALFKRMYLPVSRGEGRLLYVLARSVHARRVVEFGTSFGISTLYLAAAVRDNGGGQVITTEIEPSKCRAAEASIRQAGLGDVARVLEGDALETLGAVEGPVDLVFLDGWKDLYLGVFELLTPKLRAGALVIADNIDFPEVGPYLEHVRGISGLTSTTVGSMECSFYESSTE